jgi:hypothetical protein
MDVSEFIDLHVHIGPEVIPRKFDANELVKAEKGKIRGMALKNHFFQTSPMINSINAKKREGLLLVGSVVLNNYAGGLNPDVISAAAGLSRLPIIVWFPTINAENFLKKSKYEIPKEWVGNEFQSKLSKHVKAVRITNKKGKLTSKAVAVLKAIKDNDCILATGHLSWKESELIVKEAVKQGINKIIITHPIYHMINMPIAIQKELAKNKGVYIEQCYSMHSIDKISIAKIAMQIRIVGADKCILSSDVGQLNSPFPSKAMKQFTQLLGKEGISKKELLTMGRDNPMKLVYKQKSI